MSARWLRHPARSVLDWVGGLVVDHVFAHEKQLRRIAAYNERRGQRTPGRHRAPKPLLALLRRLNRIPRGKLGGLFLAGVGTVTLAIAGLTNGGGDGFTAPSLAVGPPPVALADDPGRRGGPMDYAPAQPPVIVAAGEPVWDPSKGPVIVDGQPLTSGSPSRPATPSPAAPAEVPVAAGTPAPAQEPDPVVGLPPVVVDPAPTGEPSTPPPDPAEQTPVVEEPTAPSDPPAADVVAELVGDETGQEPPP